jgi:superfamily II DNA helicase RecQ
MLKDIRNMPTSIMLMTSTCPPSLEQELFESLGRDVYKVLHRAMDCPEIVQKIVPVDSEDLEMLVAGYISLLVQNFQGQDQALLFCLLPEECDRMAELLGWRPYHESVPIEECSASIRLWMNGTVFRLATMLLLGCSLDYSSIQCVFHLGPPRDAVDYYYAIGQAVHRGGAGLAVMYYCPFCLKIVDGND